MKTKTKVIPLFAIAISAAAPLGGCSSMSEFAQGLGAGAGLALGALASAYSGANGLSASHGGYGSGGYTDYGDASYSGWGDGASESADFFDWSTGDTTTYRSGFDGTRSYFHNESTYRWNDGDTTTYIDGFDGENFYNFNESVYRWNAD